MNKELIINAVPQGVEIALLEDRKLVELHSEKSDARFAVGDLYLGKVKKLIPGLNAAFVDVGFEKDAFLHYTDLSPYARSLLKFTQMAMNDKSNWEKSSDRLVTLFEELAPRDQGVTVKKMFGWPCCFVNGNLFTGLYKQSMIFRLPDTDRAAFLELGGTGDFEPMPSRKMKVTSPWLTRWTGSASFLNSGWSGR